MAHLVKLLLQLIFHLFALSHEFLLNLIDLLLIRLTLKVRFNNLVHLYKAFSPQIDLIHHILLHSDVMTPMISEEGTLITDLHFTIDANNFKRLIMLLAHWFLRLLWLWSLLLLLVVLLLLLLLFSLILFKRHRYGSRT